MNLPSFFHLFLHCLRLPLIVLTEALGVISSHCPK